jgi:hypothetical protein
LIAIEGRSELGLLRELCNRCMVALKYLTDVIEQE